jgi:hypothetical protein
MIGKLRQKWKTLMEYKGRMDELWSKKVYTERSHLFNGERNVYFLNNRQSNQAIYSQLASEKPVMIARHGGYEVQVAANFDTENKITYLDELCFNAGFFPHDEKLAEDWAELYLNASKDLDFICEWNYRFGRFNEIQHVFAKYSPNALLGNDINILTPFFQDEPWTRALEGKRVLVIHPFTSTIVSQYEKRAKLFKNPQLLPEFASLETITAVQTGAGNPDPRFASWFEAYDHLCEEISKREFDVALIGCGCYGLPLAAHVKSLGMSAVHMGGALQLLFGIRGKRWDAAQDWIEQGVFNEHWVRPSDEETPQKATGVEGGCYW